MAIPTDSYACFYVLNFDCDHSEITQQLGFDPTEACNRQGTTGPEFVSTWRYIVRPIPSSEPHPNDLAGLLKTKPALPAECVASLLTTLEMHSDAIMAVSNQYQAGIHCRGPFGIELSAEILRRLSALAVPFDFACHCCFTDVDVGPVA